ncbi:hypothetical protein BTS2_1026 [Bacillus sp. TS-2]|nr:hypothetical protein BTS2_1026 [Bacillus sp. TS-2]
MTVKTKLKQILFHFALAYTIIIVLNGLLLGELKLWYSLAVTAGITFFIHAIAPIIDILTGRR